MVIRATRKKAFQSPEALNAYIAQARKSENFRPPPIIAGNLSIAERRIDGWLTYEVAPPGELATQRIIYMHGGAYCFEITSYHWRLIAELARRLRARVTVPIYPLAPEHGFGDIFDMALKVYRSLLDEADAQDIVFMGDSAGGNMAVVLTMLARQASLPQPGRHVLISPGLDMTLENPAVVEAERADPWLAIPGGLEAIRHYAADIPRTDWRISPIRGDLSGLPPTLMLTGTRDLLTPDNLRYADLARRAGVDMEVLVGDGMFHVWPLINMPEARHARDIIVNYLSRQPALAQKQESAA